LGFSLKLDSRERFKAQVQAVKCGTTEVIIAVGFIATVMDTASESVRAAEAFDVWNFHGPSSKAEWISGDLQGLESGDV